MPECVLCGRRSRTVLFAETRAGRIVRCDGCGFVFADPRSDEGVAPNRGGLCDDKIAEGETTKANFRERLEMIANKTGVSGGRLLDIGCYAGFAVEAARNAGWEAVGLEPDENAAAWGRSNLGIDIVAATVEEAVFGEGAFDLVAFNHSWEHFDDPVAALRRAVAWLRPGGVLYLEAPDFDNVWVRVLGKRWRQFIADHFFFPTRPVIRRVFEEAGLEPVHLGNHAKTLSVGLFADRVERYYAPRLGRAMSALARRAGLSGRTIRIDPGDILIALGRKRDYTHSVGGSPNL